LPKMELTTGPLTASTRNLRRRCPPRKINKTLFIIPQPSKKSHKRFRQRAKKRAKLEGPEEEDPPQEEEVPQEEDAPQEEEHLSSSSGEFAPTDSMTG